jgi:hypothetical protein
MLAFLALLALGAGTVVAMRGQSDDTILAEGYRRVLSDISPARQWQAPAAPNIWLSRADATPRPLRKPLAIGDRVSIAGKAGVVDVFEVLRVEQVEADAVGMPEQSIQIVTARPAHAEGGETVRFIFSVESVTTPAAARKPDATL